MHDVAREHIVDHSERNVLSGDSPVARFLARYGEFLTPLFCIVLLIIAWIAGEHTARGFYLAVVAMTISGYPILRRALFSTITNRKLNAEVLVVVALFASIWVGEYLAGAMVALMMNIGELLENLTIARTGEAIRSLMSLTPDEVRVVRDGQEQMVFIEDVVVDEIAIVRPGERVPIDGVVVGGSSEVDQSAITGESVPVLKEKGDGVFGGTMNHLGALQVKVTKVGNDTTLSRIVQLVMAAQQEKPPIERIADRFAAWFTPVMLTLAALVWGITGEILRAVTVLVVACPCAMVIATPTAVVAGIGNAARKGILIRGGSVLESIGSLSSVVFDKTGTLTYGHPTVQNVVGFAGQSAEEILRAAACAEKYSGHPLAEAIVEYTEEQELEVQSPENTRAIAGRGVVAVCADRQLLVGNQELLEDYGLSVSEEAVNFLKHSAEKGATGILVARNGALLGGIALADTPRPEAKEAIGLLRTLGIKKVAMLTGDSGEVAERVGDEFGVDDIFANLLPEEKLAHIQKLKEEGEVVAMVGDGINDAPSLAGADIGIAMGVAGTDTAIEAADIALTTDNLDRVAEAIALSRKTIVNIKQSFAISLVINVLALVLASTGGIGPVAGAFIHNIGSVIVVGNSSRLIGYSLFKEKRSS